MRSVETVGWLRDLKLGVNSDGLLRWTGTIFFIKNFRFELVYPPEFPAACPVPYPQDRSERWSTHQWRDGALCTEYGQDSWHPRFTGADVIRSLHDLLVGEHTPGKGFRARRPIESRHVDNPWPPPFATCGVILWPTSLLVPEGPSGELKLRFLSGSRNFRFFVSSLIDQSNRTITAAELSPPIASAQNEIVGRWYRVAQASPRDPMAIGDVQALGRALRDAGTASGDVAANLQEATHSAGDFPVPVVLVDTRGVGVAGFLYVSTTKNLLPMSVLPYQPDRISGRRATQCPALKSARVGIVGLGSLGGKIAVSLARIGIGDFVLVDPDVLLWENLSRHEGTISDIGSLKSDVIAKRIRGYSPVASVEEFDVALGSVLSPQRYEELSAALASCLIIVDASAEPQVARVLSALCQPLGIPSVHVELFARGLGALIIRVLPGTTGCYHCQGAVVAAFFKDKPVAPYQQATDYDGTPGNSPQFLTADDDACMITAGIAMRLVKDTVFQESGLPGSVPGHIYLLGLESEWIFSEPFEVTRIGSSVPNNDCVGCSGEGAMRRALQMSEEEIALVARTMEELIESGTDFAVTSRTQ
jgi:molybdopterin/thiamine biosynthesis adenylyltransferase